METRIYENGVLQGKAVRQTSDGEVEERQYVDGKLNGKATVLYSDSSKEMRTYKVRTNLPIHLVNNDTFQDNKLTGPASLFSASGERIEFEYVDGVVHGPAKIKVENFKIQNIDYTLVISRQGGGDMEECSYVNGVKHGKACYYWKAGHKEEFLYEKVSCNIIQRKQSTCKVHEYKLEICYKLRVLKLVLQCCTEQVEQQGREH